MMGSHILRTILVHSIQISHADGSCLRIMFLSMRRVDAYLWSDKSSSSSLTKVRAGSDEDTSRLNAILHRANNWWLFRGFC